MRKRRTPRLGSLFMVAAGTSAWASLLFSFFVRPGGPFLRPTRALPGPRVEPRSRLAARRG